jgi:hypothetical protein
MLKIEILPVVNKIGGPVLGVCEGFIVSIIFFMFMILIPIGYITYSANTRSLFGPFFIKAGTVLYEKSIRVISFASPKDLSQLSSGAAPLEFKIFQFKRKDKLDEILQ